MPTLTVSTNLRCGACVETIRPHFDGEKSITTWSVDISANDKPLTVQGEGVTRAVVDGLLQKAGYRALAESPTGQQSLPSKTPITYFPLLLILAYLLGTVLLFELAIGEFELMRCLRHFMAGFFLVFSFFKLLNLSAFAVAYQTYDVVAKAWPLWGYVYPFVELGLGAASLAHVWPVVVNLTALAVMAVSTVGVVQAVWRRRAIQCACLGTVFNLPMSAVTIVEDVLMVGMSIVMLILMM